MLSWSPNSNPCSKNSKPLKCLGPENVLRRNQIPSPQKKSTETTKKAAIASPVAPSLSIVSAIGVKVTAIAMPRAIDAIPKMAGIHLGAGWAVGASQISSPKRCRLSWLELRGIMSVNELPVTLEFARQFNNASRFFGFRFA